MDEQKLPVDRVFFFISLGLIWIFFRTYYLESGEYFINKSIVEFGVVSLIVLSHETVLWVSRYFMPHVTVNGHSGSILGRPVKKTQRFRIVDKVTGVEKTIDLSFAIFNTGESLEPFHFRGKISTLIFPWVSLAMSGQNYISLTSVQKVNFKSLPPRVYNFLVQNKDLYNIDNVYNSQLIFFLQQDIHF